MIAMSLPLIKGEIEEEVVAFTISPTTPRPLLEKEGEDL
jgi:hypothetical protein